MSHATPDGAVDRPLPNYALYAELYPESKEYVRKLQRAVELATRGAITVPSEDPHVTVMYGPSASAHGEDASGIEAAMDMYPEVEELKGYPGLDLKCAGFDVFDRPHQGRWILHLRVWSQHLSTLRAKLMCRYPAVADAARAAMAAAAAAGAKNLRSFSPEDEGPDHYWAHVTLGTFAKEADAAWARNLITDYTEKGIITPRWSLYASGITHLSATSDTKTLMVEFL
jgi:hypothetical protein